MLAVTVSRREAGRDLDALLWRLAEPALVASTAASGGGVGHRRWILNAQVGHDYRRTDIEQHASELAAAFALPGPGVTMLTAARVADATSAQDGDVFVQSTVGLSQPTWAAEAEAATSVTVPGTINIVVFLPVRLESGALLNALVTATEAKTQALFDASIDGTGTASDAVSIVCLGETPERFAGPRSPWGSRLARATYRAVLAGIGSGT
jgi:adenosylcobinamide hydrolase